MGGSRASSRGKLLGLSALIILLANWQMFNSSSYSCKDLPVTHVLLVPLRDVSLSSGTSVRSDTGKNFLLAISYWGGHIPGGVPELWGCGTEGRGWGMGWGS